MNEWPGYIVQQIVIKLSSLVAARPGVKDSAVIQKLGERIETALKLEIGRTRSDDGEFKEKLLEKLPTLRDLSYKHVLILNKFKQENPSVEFPALHKELFSSDGIEQPPA